jgi:hypothetical protein
MPSVADIDPQVTVDEEETRFDVEVSFLSCFRRANSLKLFLRREALDTYSSWPPRPLQPRALPSPVVQFASLSPSPSFPFLRAATLAGLALKQQDYNTERQEKCLRRDMLSTSSSSSSPQAPYSSSNPPAPFLLSCKSFIAALSCGSFSSSPLGVDIVSFRLSCRFDVAFFPFVDGSFSDE